MCTCKTFALAYTVFRRPTRAWHPYPQMHVVIKTDHHRISASLDVRQAYLHYIQDVVCFGFRMHVSLSVLWCHKGSRKVPNVAYIMSKTNAAYAILEMVQVWWRIEEGGWGRCRLECIEARQQCADYSHADTFVTRYSDVNVPWLDTKNGHRTC